MKGNNNSQKGYYKAGRRKRGNERHNMGLPRSQSDTTLQTASQYGSYGIMDPIRGVARTVCDLGLKIGGAGKEISNALYGMIIASSISGARAQGENADFGVFDEDETTASITPSSSTPSSSIGTMKSLLTQLRTIAQSSPTILPSTTRKHIDEFASSTLSSISAATAETFQTISDQAATLEGQMGDHTDDPYAPVGHNENPNLVVPVTIAALSMIAIVAGGIAAAYRYNKKKTYNVQEAESARNLPRSNEIEMSMLTGVVNESALDRYPDPSYRSTSDIRNQGEFNQTYGEPYQSSANLNADGRVVAEVHRDSSLPLNLRQSRSSSSLSQRQDIQESNTQHRYRAPDGNLYTAVSTFSREDNQLRQGGRSGGTQSSRGSQVNIETSRRNNQLFSSNSSPARL